MLLSETNWRAHLTWARGIFCAASHAIEGGLIGSVDASPSVVIVSNLSFYDRIKHAECTMIILIQWHTLRCQTWDMTDFVFEQEDETRVFQIK